MPPSATPAAFAPKGVPIRTVKTARANDAFPPALSRPVGGTNAFRDALERSYRNLGGEVLLHATVDEVIVDDASPTAR